MTAELEVIKIAYEQEGMSPSEIAEDRSLDETAVKAALMNCSSKYRKNCGHESEIDDGLNFTDSQLRSVNQVIFETALEAQDAAGNPDYRVRLAAAQYIRDDKKGRKEVIKQMGGNTFNILSFNEQIQQARENVKKLKSRVLEIA